MENHNCEYCSHYFYEEEYEYYACEIDLDEDEMERFLRGTQAACPYFSYDNEYKIVRKQM